jgi:hypothetical protein
MPVLNITTPQGFIILPATPTGPERIMVPFSARELEWAVDAIHFASSSPMSRTLTERLDEAADELEGA